MRRALEGRCPHASLASLFFVLPYFLPRVISYRWRSLAKVVNVSSFQGCLHNTDIPSTVFNVVSHRDNLKKIAIYLGLPDWFDDDFEYIVRRSKFMVNSPPPPFACACMLMLATGRHRKHNPARLCERKGLASVASRCRAHLSRSTQRRRIASHRVIHSLAQLCHF